MIVRVCYIAALLLMFGAGVAFSGSAEYVVCGWLRIHSDGPDKQVCELRIGNGTDSREKVLLVSKTDMALAAACRAHVGDRVVLRLRFASKDFRLSPDRDGAGR